MTKKTSAIIEYKSPNFPQNGSELYSIAGIDYSYTSPAICIHYGNTWSYDNCEFHFFNNSNKIEINEGKYIGHLFPEANNDIDKFHKLGDWVVDITSDCDRLFLEGYSFSSTGRVFQIGENTGILKHKIRKKTVDIFPPTMIKKYATGKGNANKEKMREAFFAELGVDLYQRFMDAYKRKNVEKPAADIIDSYYIAKLGFFSDSALP